MYLFCSLNTSIPLMSLLMTMVPSIANFKSVRLLRTGEKKVYFH